MTIVRALLEHELERTSRFLCEHFYGQEPLMRTPGDHQVVFDDAERRAHRLQLIRQGTSLAALDGQRFVGVALAGVIQRQHVEQNWLEASARRPEQLIEHVHYFLADVERRAEIFECYDVTDTLYLSTLAVDASVRRQGLGRQLVSALMELGRAKGLRLLVATCTSRYSSRLMSALGMECVLSERYSGYKDDQGRVVIQPPEPHEAADVMAIRL